MRGEVGDAIYKLNRLALPSSCPWAPCSSLRVHNESEKLLMGMREVFSTSEKAKREGK